MCACFFVLFCFPRFHFFGLFKWYLSSLSLIEFRSHFSVDGSGFAGSLSPTFLSLGFLFFFFLISGTCLL